jgi:hypothetical protein
MSVRVMCCGVWGRRGGVRGCVRTFPHTETGRWIHGNGQPLASVKAVVGLPYNSILEASLNNTSARPFLSTSLFPWLYRSSGFMLLLVRVWDVVWWKKSVDATLSDISHRGPDFGEFFETVAERPGLSSPCTMK